MPEWIPKCADCKQVPVELFIATTGPTVGNIYCGGCRLVHPEAQRFDDRVRGLPFMSPALNEALENTKPIVFELDGKPCAQIGTDYLMAYSAGVPTSEVERDILRGGERVTVFLPYCDLWACQTVQEFKSLLANRVTPVLDELVAKWEEMRKGKG